MISNVVVFASLFLGLVTGEQRIEVVVSEDVTAVRVLVDGVEATVLDGEPWSLDYDFGAALTTRELSAIALDENGNELGRATQQLNVPRPRVEAEVLLDRWHDRRPRAARVIWHSTDALEPLEATVAVNGNELAVADLDRIELPELDPDRLHFITAELVFPTNETASAEAVFGGAYGTAVETELTAVPLHARAGRLQPISATRGWLRRSDGTDLPIVAIEPGPAEVAVVREDEAMYSLARLDQSMRRSRDRSYKALRLGRRDRVRFVSTKPTQSWHSEFRYDIFPVSRAFGPQDGALPGLLAGVLFTGDQTPAQQLTDAVAIAGRFAVETQKRRAVVLITIDCTSVDGQYDPHAVRAYLKELNVPLKVWQVARVRRKDRDSGLCRDAEEIYSGAKYSAAIRRLRSELHSQQLVWVRGRPLPREIMLTSAARGVRLAGR